MTFSSFSALVDSGEALKRGLYLALTSPSGPSLLSPLKDTAAGPDLPSPDTLWISPPGHTEQLHYDTFDNFVFQLSGSKTWTLFPPSSVPLLNLPLSASPNFSRLDLSSPSPALEALADLTVTMTLHPGDVLFVPACWYHSVASDPGSPMVISANKFVPAKRKLEAPWMHARVAIAEKVGQLVERWREYRQLPPPTVDAILGE
jgi:ribosomal protein L16 Arg81 hydroxylase